MVTRGRTLFYTATDSRTANGDIWRSTETGISKLIVKTHRDERYGTARLTADGWHTSPMNRISRGERACAARARRSTPDLLGGGSQPQWSREGLELVYMALDRSLMSVAIQRPGRLCHEPPRRLFRTRTKSFEIQGTARTYAIARDGQRFLVANATERRNTRRSGRAELAIVARQVSGRYCSFCTNSCQRKIVPDTTASTVSVPCGK